MTLAEQAREKAREFIWRKLVYVQSGGENTKFLGPEELTPFEKMPESQFVSMPFGKLLTALADFYLHMEGQGWVKCSERLPDTTRVVLFVTNEKDRDGNSIIESGWRCASGPDPMWQCERTAPQDEPITYEYDRVLYWRELPAPPDQTEEEK